MAGDARRWNARAQPAASHQGLNTRELLRKSLVFRSEGLAVAAPAVSESGNESYLCIGRPSTHKIRIAASERRCRIIKHE